MAPELDEIYKMYKWSNEEIMEELSRPVDRDIDMFQKCLEREALRRILQKNCQDNKRVGDAITKACRIIHFDGVLVIPMGVEKTREHEILEELYTVLNLAQTE